MPCRAKPQFRRGRLDRCVRSLELLRDGQQHPTAELWGELTKVEPALDPSVARNTLSALERRGYVEGETHYLPNTPGGRQRRWVRTDLGQRVLDRLQRLHQTKASAP